MTRTSAPTGTRRTHLLRIVAAMCLTPAHIVCCEALTIRVLNAESGRPLAQQPVVVFFLYANSLAAVKSQHRAALTFRTNQNGDALIPLTNPMPASVSLRVKLTSEHWHCGCSVLAETQDVLRSGVLESSLKGKPARMTGKPGEVLFLARPYTFIERVMAPFERE